MGVVTDWRDTFCGRERELEALVARYEEVAAGKGPRLSVVLGDRGMGKTRLVQELYRTLATRHDPQNYWPDASLFEGNNLRVAPELSDPAVRAHFESFKVSERPMPFLWWGFRLADPDVRNAARSDMAAHRTTLEPHLAPVRFARQIGAARERMRQAGIDAASESGKSILKAVVSSIPGFGAVATVFDLFLDYASQGKDAAEAVREELRLRQAYRESSLLQSEIQRNDDIQERTLEDVVAMLSPAEGASSLPVVIFCDDAQFARDGGDEGVLRFLTTLWERAHLADWPLLLVLTHWGVEWHRAADTSIGKRTCASELGRSARSSHMGLVIDLPKEPALAGLVTAGLPGLPDQDVALLLGKADGNPQVLIELIELARRSPAWRRAGSGELTPHARQEIDRRATHLAELILERLESDATPEGVRQAVALSSLQGMEFLRLLTEAAAQAFMLSGAAEGLDDAQNPHRLVVGVDKGVAGFVQRAYREAAARLVGGHVGDPQDVERALLDVAIALVDNTDRYSSLTPYEQTATWGVVVGLAEAHADATVRRYAGMGLLRLIGDAMRGERGADYARAAELALRFEAGVGMRWSLQDFDLGDMRRALDAISTWHGPARTALFSAQLLLHARELVAKLVTTEALRDLSVSLNYVGPVAWAQGEWAEAERVYRESLTIRRELAARLGTPEALRDLSTSLDHVGRVARAQGNWAEAERVHRESLAISCELAAKLGTPEAQRELSTSLDNVGAVAWAQGDWIEAEKAYRESLAIRRELATKLGTPEAQRELSTSLDNVGAVARAQGEWAEAERVCRESLTICRDLAAKLGTPKAQRALSLSLNYIGAVARVKGDWAEAERVYRESLAIRRDLAAKLGTPEAQRDVSVSLDHVGGVARAQGNWAEAEQVYCECLAISRDLIAKLGIPEAQRDLSVSLDNVGEVVRAQGDWTEAEKAYRESLAIRRELVAKLGTPEAQLDLSVSLDKVGAVAWAKGDCIEAEKAYRESLAIRRELAAKLGGARREIGLSLIALGTLVREQGRADESCKLLCEAKPIFEALEKHLNTPNAVAEAKKLRELLEQHRCGC